ncbi:hypothetical protein GCM10027449_32060 [Sinomonas notoginsengisoli]
MPEFLDDLGEPIGPGLDGLTGEQVRVNNHRAALSQTSGHRRLARGDPARQPYSQHGPSLVQQPPRLVTVSEISRATAYTTIDGEHRHELEVKRSRFITVLRRAASEDEARALVAALRREFHDARHHCSAFVLGPDRTTQRSSDDGEPSGTAGLPMLEALVKCETHDGPADLSDIVAVVVRYFGGILLGSGGLVRAYSESVAAALGTATLVRRQRLRVLGIEVPHAVAPRLENDLRGAGVVVLGADYGMSCAALRVAIEDSAARASDFAGRLAGLTGGTCVALPLGTSWIDLR